MKKLLLLLIAATMGLSFTAQNLNASRVPKPEQRPSRDAVLSRIISTDRAVVVKFTAFWCDVCRDMKGLDKKMRAQFKEATFLEVDIIEDKSFAERYEVVGTPTYIFFKDGNEIKRKSGAIKENNYADLIKSIVK